MTMALFIVIWKVCRRFCKVEFIEISISTRIILLSLNLKGANVLVASDGGMKLGLFLSGCLFGVVVLKVDFWYWTQPISEYRQG
jgi:hypothetical protein